MGQVLQRNGGTGNFQPKGDGKFDKEGTVGIQRLGTEGIVKEVVETKDGPKQILDQREPTAPLEHAQTDPKPTESPMAAQPPAATETEVVN